MEQYEKCESNDGKCLQNMGEVLMKWMVHDRPEYFIEAIDPMYFHEWRMTIQNEVYKLRDVNVTGVASTVAEYIE